MSRGSGPFLSFLALAGACLAAPACQPGAPGEGGPFSVRDSAGIQVVESARPLLQESRRWSLDPEPFLSIGEVDGEVGYLLNNAGSAQVLSDGRILVANRGDLSLRLYTPDGRFLRSVGRRGQGPGEFSSIGGVYVRGEEIVVHPVIIGAPVQVFDTEGKPLRQLRLHGVPALSPLQVRGVFGDGSPVVAWIPQPTAATGAVGDASLGEAPLFRVSPDGSTADSLTSMPMVRYTNVGLPSTVPQLFGPYGFIEVGEAHAYLGWSESHEIELVDRSGSLVRIQRWAGELHPVTREQQDLYRDDLLSALGPGGAPLPEDVRRRRRQIAEGTTFPTHHQTFERLLLDGAGYLWVQRYDPRRVSGPGDREAARGAPTVWDVFDPEGVWVDTVETPFRLNISSIGADYVAGVWRDDLGVERVRLHRLRRTAG